MTLLTRASVPFLLLSLALSLNGCPKQQNIKPSGAQPAATEPARFSGSTAKFVAGLCSLKAYAYTMADAGAAVVYEQLSFAEQGTFSAQTTIRLGDEPFQCQESGTWSMDEERADSPTSAALSLEVTETNCAGRSAPTGFRVRAQLQGDEIVLSHI